jgi:Spy/CpxP family protein refolding chaperone
LFSPAVVLGQDMMGGKWWQSKRITEELKITDNEKSQLNETYTAGRRELITLKSNVERERFELDNLLDQKDAKKKDIVDQFNRLEAARSNLSAERFNLLLGVRDIVGIERYQQLKILHRMKRDKRTKKFNDKRRERND